MGITNAFHERGSHIRCRRCKSRLMRLSRPDTDVIGYRCVGVMLRDDIWVNQMLKPCEFAVAVYNGGKGREEPPQAA
jgi:hypothetical protein